MHMLGQDSQRSLMNIYKHLNKKGGVDLNNKRFDVTQSQGSGFFNFYQVIVDKQTGVNYLCVKAGYGSGLTPLLDENGKPIVTK